MKAKKMVVALGGNALGNTLAEQKAAVSITAKAIVDLLEEGHRVVLCHGNGPQVGMINLAFETACKTEPSIEKIPLSVSVAMSQGYIGYDLQNACRYELMERGMDIPVATLITQVVVDENDPAFQNPTKPIGSFYTREQAEEIMRQKPEIVMREDAGRGYRRVVASPKPVDVVEKETALAMLEHGHLVIACGGGGIPVKWQGNFLKGCAAVIDKDFAGEKLAEIVDADAFIILTAVEKVAIHFGRPEERWLDSMTAEEAEQYIQQGHFAKGSMLPKVQAAVRFVRSGPGRETFITALEKARDCLAGRTGTRILP